MHLKTIHLFMDILTVVALKQASWTVTCIHITWNIVTLTILLEFHVAVRMQKQNDA